MPLFRAWFRRARSENELNRELEFHLAQETEARVRAGLSPEEARAAAERSFGGVAQVQEQVRDAWGVRVLDQIRQDLAYAWRGLGRNPGFTLAAGLTLVIGIGASTVMFSVVQAVLLRPPPYREPGRLVAVWSEVPRLGVNQAYSGYANIEDWRRMSRTLSGLAAWDGQTSILTSPTGEASRVSPVLVSANFTTVLGVQPNLGRSFTPEEEARREPLAVLSDRFWRTRFNASPDAIGRDLVVDGRSFRIIGVMPPGFYFPSAEDDFWIPVTLSRGWEQKRQSRGTDSWRIIARLAPGSSLRQAQAELAGIAAALRQSYPSENEGLDVTVVPLSLDRTGRQTRLAILVLAGAVLAVLLIACGNVANLLLARGATRQREFAVREALGASRGRIVAQLLAESALLALVSAAIGAGLAFLMLKAVRAFGPAGIPRLNEASLDGPALAFAVGLSFLSAVAVGLVPALGSTRRNAMEMLRSAGRGLSETRSARRLRTALVVAEFTLAIVLVVAAGLLSRSFVRLAAIDTGFTARGVLMVAMRYPAERPEDAAGPFARQALENVRRLPGVFAAGIGEEVLGSEASDQPVAVEGAGPALPVVSRVGFRTDSVTPGYFEAVGMPLRQGRLFEERDAAAGPPVVIVNETLARRLWPGADPVGRRMKAGDAASDAPWLTVVGVVADVRRKGPERPPTAQAFRPFAQRPSRGMILLVATDLAPASLVTAVRAAVNEADPGVPLYGVGTLREELDRMLAPREFNLGLIGTFAVIAVTLAGIGIFGLMNYAVARRTQEIGVRMALGAQPGDVLRMVLSDGLKLALAGIGLGVVGAVALMPVLSSLLYGVGFADPLSFGGAIVILFGIALLACYLPARRAIAVSPVMALKAE
jgi:putative ABC transport system permease protein